MNDNSKEPRVRTARERMLTARADRQSDWMGERASSYGAVERPASLNRRTGKPHEHTRAKARNLRRAQS